MFGSPDDTGHFGIEVETVAEFLDFKRSDVSEFYDPTMLESSFPMKISIGADHAGFLLKERLRQKLIADGHQVADRGTDSEQSCDYPDFAAAVAHDVAGGLAE